MSKHRRPTHSRRRAGLAAAALGVAALTTLGASAPAMAAKGGGTSKPPGGKHQTSYTGSFSLVLLESSDGVPHWGQRVTFDVTSNAPYYFVSLDCYQNGSVVYRQSVGFYTGWAWSQDFVLKSAVWTGGAADCNGRLYSSNSDGSNEQTLATMSFHVEA